MPGRLWRWGVVVGLTASIGVGHARSPARPPADGQVTFLYYKDLDGAARFYGGTLGLRATLDQGWVRIFEVSPTSYIGLVDATSGAHRPSAEKPVMVSILVNTPSDVDRWHAWITSRGVTADEAPTNVANVPIRAFSFKDPEGYTLEVFTWR